MRPGTIAFDKWFESIYGPRPSALSRNELWDQERRTALAATDARQRLDVIDQWEDRRSAALASWEAASKSARSKKGTHA